MPSAPRLSPDCWLNSAFPIGKELVCTFYQNSLPPTKIRSFLLSRPRRLTRGLTLSHPILLFLRPDSLGGNLYFELPLSDRQLQAAGAPAPPPH